MRTVCLNFESSSVALACGAPGHSISAIFNTNPIGRVLDRLTVLFDIYSVERVLIDGEDSAAMASVKVWLADRGQAFQRMPESALTQMTDLLTMGAADLDIVDGPALFENCRPGEDRAIAALELNHRLATWSADQLRQTGIYS